MEVKEWATRILGGDTLEEKLLPPRKLTDYDPGAPTFWAAPSRPSGMRFQKRSKQEKLPPLQQLQDPDKRAICLHRFASHELLAVEIMAHALVAFPEAPKEFREGVIQTLREEQGHVRLYQKELQRFGLKLGDMPMYKHFWASVPYLTTPLKYVSVMSLTFEMANLDFAPIYGKQFSKYEDFSAEKLMKRIFLDELRHVNFGWEWLKHFQKPDRSEWDTWISSLPPYLDPKRAKGKVFHKEHRTMAGVSDNWIEHFEQSIS